MGSRSGNIHYPIRFFNMLCFQRPSSSAEMFKWCATLSESHGLFGRVMDTMSRYPITKAKTVNDSGLKKNYWETLLNKKLKIQNELVANGKDFFSFGNAVVSIVPPFNRYLVCPKCNKYLAHLINGENSEDSPFKWSYKGYAFYGTCLTKDEEGKRCGYHGVMEVKDEFLEGEAFNEKLKIQRFPMLNIKIDDLSIAGKKKIYYKLEKKYSNAITKGKRFTVANVPYTFILACKKNPTAPIVELAPELTFHYKSESITEPEMDGLSKPFFISSWKDIFMSFVLAKAQEMIAGDHMIPNRFIFPSTTPDGAGPLSKIDGGSWVNIITTQIKRQQNDPNEIGITPFPIGYQALGGQGKAMSLREEIELQDRRLLTQWGIPPELIFGGMTWSGSNISLRMLENLFRYYVDQHNTFLDFFVNYASAQSGINRPDEVYLMPFKMADDIQQINLRSSLGAQNRISESSALAHVDGITLQAEAEQAEQDLEYSRRIMVARQKAAAMANLEISKDSTLQQVNTQAEVQNRQNDVATSAQSASQSGITDGYIAMTMQGMINKLNSIPPQDRGRELLNLQSQNPSLYNQVVSQMFASVPESANDPLPQAKAPRRGPEKAKV